jgi:hypothetical protein
VNLMAPNRLYPCCPNCGQPRPYYPEPIGRPHRWPPPDPDEEAAKRARDWRIELDKIFNPTLTVDDLRRRVEALEEKVEGRP